MASPGLMGDAVLSLATDPIFLVDAGTLELSAANRAFSCVLGHTSDEATRLKLEAQMEQIRITAEAEQIRAQLRLTEEIQQAKAALDHPALLKLRELEALGHMARSGAKFVVGFSGKSGLADAIVKETIVEPR